MTTSTTRSTRAEGTKFRSGTGVIGSPGCRRLPSISTRVRAMPRPRRLTVAVPVAPLDSIAPNEAMACWQELTMSSMFWTPCELDVLGAHRRQRADRGQTRVRDARPRHHHLLNRRRRRRRRGRLLGESGGGRQRQKRRPANHRRGHQALANRMCNQDRSSFSRADADAARRHGCPATANKGRGFPLFALRLRYLDLKRAVNRRFDVTQIL